MAKNFDNVPKSADHKWEDEITTFKFERVEQYQFRLIGDIFVFGRHWVATKPLDIDGGKKFPRECTNFDPDTETHCLDHGCPTCTAEKDPSTPDKAIGTSHHYMINAIDRQAQSDGMRNPVKIVGPLPPTLVSQIIDLKKSNRGKANAAGVKEGYHVVHPDFGRDVLLKYDAKGTPRWTVSADLDGQSPLTDEEKAYKLFDLDSIYPNFAKEEVRNAYNEDSLRSLKRCGYFEADAKPAAAKPRGSNGSAPRPSHAQKPAEPQDDDSGADEPAPAKAANPTTKLPLQKADVAAGECPHTDQDEHSFGNFQASAFCMRCPQRMSCMTASENN